MEHYSNYLRKKGLSISTITNHIKMLSQFKRWTETENINTEETIHNELLTYIQYNQEKGNKQVSIQRTINVLKHYFEYLQDQCIRYDNPTEKIEIHGVQRKKMHTLLDPKELENLYNNYPLYETVNSELQQNRSKRNKVITGLIIWQGLDTTALKLLTTKHIDLRAGIIKIPGSKRTEPRELKLESGQLFDLMEYTQNILPQLSGIPLDTEQYMFKTEKIQGLQNSLNRLAYQLKKLNSNVISLKQIRANVIINWLKKHNLRQGQYMAGHRYVSSTEAYQLNDIEDLKQELIKFHPLG